MLGKIAGASAIADALSRLEEDGSVVAVVLRVSSPGGADTAADTIWRAARQLGMRKPLIASFGDTAASGGYWIATAADRVVAEPLSITGSIGVWAGKFSIGGLLGKIGLAMEAVSADGNPNWLSPARPLEADDLARLRETIGETYRVFLERVAAARGLTPEEVDAVGQGRVFTGRQALGAGLVDELGGLRRAIRLAASAAGVPEDAPVETIFLPEPPTLLEALEARLDTAPGLRERTSLLAAMAGGTRMVLLPFQPRIR